jgi:hypothetical protein
MSTGDEALSVAITSPHACGEITVRLSIRIAEWGRRRRKRASAVTSAQAAHWRAQGVRTATFMRMWWRKLAHGARYHALKVWRTAAMRTGCQFPLITGGLCSWLSVRFEGHYWRNTRTGY